MPNLYCISGLGADSRAFSKIETFEGYQTIFLDWLPNLPNEKFNNYISRLIEGQNINENDVVLGLSFGGLAALEIAKQTTIKKVVLLSSFRDKNDLKSHLKLLLDIRLYNLIPNFKMNFFDRQAVKGFGDVSEEAKEGLLEMMQDTDQRFIKWALKQIRKSNFIDNSQTELVNVLGTNDEMLKVWKLPSKNFYIENGGHLMVYENAEEINKTLKLILQAK